MDPLLRLKRLRFRAWHRGTREADYVFGGYFDAHHLTWTAAEVDWFEALLEEQDVDVLGWATGSLPVPSAWDGAMMRRLRAMDYVKVA